MTARDASKGRRVRDDVAAEAGNQDVHLVALDLARLASVEAAARQVLRGWDQLDLLLCNAGHQPARERTTTADGYETTFGVNHLGHALLVDRLLDRLRASAPSRVVIVASEAHRRAGGGLDFDDLMMQHGRFRPGHAYGRSKLANILYTRELARRTADTGITAVAVHPGGVDTPMMRGNFRGPILRRLYTAIAPRLFLTPEDAAAGVLRVSLDPALADTTGEYFEIGVHKKPARLATDDAAARRLWAVTAQLVGTRP